MTRPRIREYDNSVRKCVCEYRGYKRTEPKSRETRSSTYECQLCANLGKSSTMHQMSLSEYALWQTQKVYIRHGGQRWNAVQNGTPLNGRGLTYQESIFAHQRPVFIDNQVIWWCKTCQELEASGMELKGDWLIMNSPHTTFQGFKALCGEFENSTTYSECEFLG